MNDRFERNIHRFYLILRWINIGCDQLRPYVPCKFEIKEKHLRTMEGRGLSRALVIESTRQQKFDAYHAMYLLLEEGERVCIMNIR